MDKKSIVYVILGLIIVFLAAFLIISHVSTTDFEQQTFTNFVMDVPKGTMKHSTTLNSALSFKMVESWLVSPTALPNGR